MAPTKTPVDKPDPPESAPKYLIEGFDKQNTDTLRELAEYAQRLADWNDAQAAAELEEQATDVKGTPDEWDDEEWDDALDEAREKADLSAGKGTLTMKQIDGRGYYYLQWRQGSKIKSAYVAPVSPAGSN
jgi:hypothetical protein